MDDAFKRQAAWFTNEEKETMASFLRRKNEYEQQVANIQGKIAEMHSVYSTIYNSRRPVLSLPNEVTCLIFDYAQLPGGQDEFGKDHGEDWQLMEVDVSQVCHHWRSIALGYPNLWTKFYYGFYFDFPDRKVPLKRLEVYLKRSRTLPLYLWFDFREDWDNPLNSQLLRLAIDHAERWKQFTLYADGDIEVFDCLSRIQNLHAPLLECLVLATGRGPDNEMDSLSVINLDAALFRGGAPNLKFCMMDDYAFLNFIPPLWKITTLQIDGERGARRMPSQVFFNLLTLPSLQHLSLIGDFPQPTTLVYEIKMPNLERLHISDFNGMWFYLPYIRAPRLEFLVICRSHFSSDTSGTRTHLLDQYSFPSLRKLWISNSNMDEGVVDCFTRLTSEATNVLIASPNLEIFFRFICWNLVTGKLWPRLTVMTTNICGLISIEPYMIFASSRSKSFTFRLRQQLLSRWKEDDAYRKLEELCLLEPICEKNWPIFAEPFWPIEMKAAPRITALDDPCYEIRRYHL